MILWRKVDNMRSSNVYNYTFKKVTNDDILNTPIPDDIEHVWIGNMLAFTSSAILTHFQMISSMAPKDNERYIVLYNGKPVAANRNGKAHYMVVESGKIL